MSASYPRIPVRVKDWEDSHRRCAEAINWLLDKMPTKAILHSGSDAAYVCNAASPAEIILPYSYDPDSAYATADGLSGIITINDPGLYLVSANVAFGNGVNGESYLLELQHTVDTVPSYENIAVNYWGSPQMPAMSLAGQTFIAMGKGDQCAIGIYSTAATTLDIVDAEIQIEQVT